MRPYLTLLLLTGVLLGLVTPCWAPGGRSNLEIFLDSLTDEGSPIPAITSPTTASGTVGTAFSYQITATNAPTSYGATGLPGGLTVNISTGLISGTPTTAGISSVSLQATNASGTGALTLTVTITIPQLSAQLYLHWRLDQATGQMVLDSGTCSCPGTPLNAPPSTGGRIGTALTFNGTNQAVQNTAFPWPAAQPFTLELWVNAPGGTPNGTFAIGTGTDRIGAHIPWSDNQLYFDVFDIGTGRTSFDYTPYLNRWTHVTLLYDGVNTRKIYINGQLTVTNTTAITAPSARSGFNVGLYQVGTAGAAYQTGALDDVRLYTEARSDAQILADSRLGLKAVAHRGRMLP